jgi:peptidoglycan-N-acetylglucosamine deacetylase
VAGEFVRSFKKNVFVTTSWDDGDWKDLQLAELLQQKGICGTFYIPMQYRERPLSHANLRTLVGEGFEIGAHGWTHKLLWRLRPEEVKEEVQPCKKALEDIVGREVKMFCYPKGRYDASTMRVLNESGYSGARTVRMLATRSAFPPFAMPTTLQVYPHGQWAYLKNIGRARSGESLRSCIVELPRLGSWVELGKSMFDAVLRDGGIWHLCGHSWEIEELGLWDALHELLGYVSQREGVRYVPNCSLLQPQLASLAPSELVQQRFVNPRQICLPSGIRDSNR